MCLVCRRLWLPYPIPAGAHAGSSPAAVPAGSGRRGGAGPGAAAPRVGGGCPACRHRPAGAAAGSAPSCVLLLQIWRERAWTYRERREGSLLGAVTGGGRLAAPAACGSTGAVTGGSQEPCAEGGTHPSVSYPGSLCTPEPVRGCRVSWLWLGWWGFVVFLFPVGTCRWQRQSLSCVWNY